MNAAEIAGLMFVSVMLGSAITMLAYTLGGRR